MSIWPLRTLGCHLMLLWFKIAQLKTLTLPWSQLAYLEFISTQCKIFRPLIFSKRARTDNISDKAKKKNRFWWAMAVVSRATCSHYCIMCKESLLIRCSSRVGCRWIDMEFSFSDETADALFSPLCRLMWVRTQHAMMGTLADGRTLQSSSDVIS